MVKFLISRPIAVTMVLIAFLVLGFVSLGLIPVSLMPNVDIPKITVLYNADGFTARELENTVIKQLRSYLMQTNKLTDLKSEVSDGSATVSLTYEYGTNIDLAFIDVNEKLDRATELMPKGLKRPRVIKANATDIPVFYLNLTLKKNTNNIESISELYPVSNNFLELSNFSDGVIRKRIEQLSEVAMVDMSGLVKTEILLLPFSNKMDALNITIEDIENTILKNNINAGNILLNDGKYQYSIRVTNDILSKTDIENLYLEKNGKIWQIKELAEVIEHPQKLKGQVYSDHKPAISMAIIKQSGAQMRLLKEKLDYLIGEFEKDYPDIEFTITRNQTQLLDYSIKNLKSSLIFGAILAIVVMLFFLNDFKSPLLIAISLPTSLIISMLLLYLFKLSFNIISLSGLILGVGMMIDNAIIVIDNINQYNIKTRNLALACIKGTNEVFSPLLSSVLTSCSVFIPLIFMPGMAGALFYDQAVSISIGLLVSLLVSITILPVFYNQLYIKNNSRRPSEFLTRINRLNYLRFYEKGFRFVMRHQKVIFTSLFFMLIIAVWLFKNLDKERFPVYAQNDTMLAIDWNEKINLVENNKRINLLLENSDNLLTHYTCYTGQQQFTISGNDNKNSEEALLYLKTNDEADVTALKKLLELKIQSTYPQATYEFKSPGNLFDLMFETDEPYLQARIQSQNSPGKAYYEKLQALADTLSAQLQLLDKKEGSRINKTKKQNNELQQTNELSKIKITTQELLIINIDLEKLLIYQIELNSVIKALKGCFSVDEILVLNKNENFLPVVIGRQSGNFYEMLNNLTVANKYNQFVHLNNLVTITHNLDLKNIISGKEGEYFPLDFHDKGINIDRYQQVIQKISASQNFNVFFTGSYFSNIKLVKNMVAILVVSLLILFFILAAQFESMWLPLIVLIEVPIDLLGAFLFLWLFGSSINLMSMIGVIVAVGIVINDSILKIDTINQLRRQGYGLLRSLIIAGQRRLIPILMTSITTILALVPFLVTNGMGSDLQKPLALSIIGSMLVGTLVSLFFIPLSYYHIEKLLKKNT